MIYMGNNGNISDFSARFRRVISQLNPAPAQFHYQEYEGTIQTLL